MLSDFLSTITHASWLSGVMLILAMISFVAIVVWVIRLDKRMVRKLERLPLDTSDDEYREGEDSHV